MSEPAAAPYVTPCLLQPARSLQQLIDKCDAELKTLPLHSTRRAALIRSIRWAEDELERKARG